MYDFSSHIAIDLKSSKNLLLEKEACLKIAPTDIRYKNLPNSFFHHYPEFFFQLGGVTDFSFPQQKFTLKENEIAIVPRGVPHGELARHTETKFKTLVIVLGPIGTAFVYAKEMNGIPKGIWSANFPKISLNEVSKLIELMTYFHKFNPKVSQYMMTGLLTMIEDTYKKGMTSSRKKECSPLINQCIQLLNRKYPQSICNLAFIAQELHCTPNYLSGKFSQEYGLKFTSCLLELRIKHAKELLLYSDFSINQIALASGFEHPSYFIAKFKHITMQTPKKYRQEIQHKNK